MNFKPIVSFESELPLATEAHRMTAHLDAQYSYYNKALNLDDHNVLVKKTPFKKEVIVVPGTMDCLVQVYKPDTEHPGSWLPVTAIDMSSVLSGWTYPSAGFITAAAQPGDPDDGRTRVASSGTTKASTLTIVPDAGHAVDTPWVSVLPTGGVPGNQRWWDSRTTTKAKKRLDWWVSYPFVPQRSTQWYISEGMGFKTAYGAPRGLRLSTKPLTMAYQGTKDALVVVEAPTITSFLPQTFVEYTGLPLFIPVVESLTFRRYTYSDTPPQGPRWTLAYTSPAVNLRELEVSDRPHIDCKRYVDETSSWNNYFTNLPTLTTPLVVSDDGTKVMAQLRFGTFWGGPYPTNAGEAELIRYDPQDPEMDAAGGRRLPSYTNNSYHFIGVQWETNPTKFLMDYYFEVKQYKKIRVDYAVLRVNADGVAATLRYDRSTFGVGANAGWVSKTSRSTYMTWQPISYPSEVFYIYSQRTGIINSMANIAMASKSGEGVFHTAEYSQYAGWSFDPQGPMNYDGPYPVFGTEEFAQLCGLPGDFFDVARGAGTIFSRDAAPEEVTAQVTGEGASVMMGDYFDNNEVWLFTRYNYTLSAEGVSNGGTNLFKSGSITTSLIVKDGATEFNLGGGSTNGASRREFTPLVVDLKAGVIVYVEGVYAYDGGLRFTPTAVKAARRSTGWAPMTLSLALAVSVEMYVPGPQVPRPVGRTTTWDERIYRRYMQAVDAWTVNKDTGERNWRHIWMRECYIAEVTTRITTEPAEHNSRVLNEAVQIVNHWEPKDYNDEPIVFPQLGSVSMDGNRVLITGSRGLLKDPLVELKWDIEAQTYAVVHHLSDGVYSEPDGNLREARFSAGHIQNVHFSNDGPLLPWPEPSA